MLKHKKTTFCVALVLALAAQASWAADNSSSFKLGAGVDYTSGKYGTSQTTDITQVPVSFRYDTGDWSFKLTVPYINVTGPSNVIPGVGKVQNCNPKSRGHDRGPIQQLLGCPGGTTPTTTSGSASGLGDIVAAATYNAYRNDSTNFGIDLTGKVKFGTADVDKGLGTGKNDYSFEADLYKGYGAWTVFGGVGYTWLGSSQYIKLNNVVNTNAGASYKLDDSSSIGAYYDYRQKSADTGFSRSEVTGYYAYKLSTAWRFQAYATKGFTDGSPDWGVGASTVYAF